MICTYHRHLHHRHGHRDGRDHLDHRARALGAHTKGAVPRWIQARAARAYPTGTYCARSTVQMARMPWQPKAEMIPWVQWREYPLPSRRSAVQSDRHPRRCLERWDLASVGPLLAMECIRPAQRSVQTMWKSLKTWRKLFVCLLRNANQHLLRHARASGLVTTSGGSISPATQCTFGNRGVRKSQNKRQNVCRTIVVTFFSFDGRSVSVI